MATAKTPKPKTAKQAIASLSADQKAAVMAAVMEFPQGCTSGKIEFARQYGLPLPPAKVEVAADFMVLAGPDDLQNSRYDGSELKAAARTRIQKEIAARLTAAGFEGVEVSVGLA